MRAISISIIQIFDVIQTEEKNFFKGIAIPTKSSVPASKQVIYVETIKEIENFDDLVFTSNISCVTMVVGFKQSKKAVKNRK